jgi:C4-dicarboxylate transporter DctM subunit
MAGILPGILISILLMLTGYRVVKQRNVQQTVAFSLRDLAESFIDGIAALIMPVIVLGGIYRGVFTATEAGATAVVYGFLASWLIYRELNWEKIKRIFAGSVNNTILVMAVLAVSGPFSWLLATEGISETVGNLIQTYAESRIVFLMIVNILFFVVGCFMETGAAILIFTPIIFPTAIRLGINPVHLGVIIVANLSFGMATPPVGENQYIAAAIAEIPFDQQVKAAFPFLFAAFAGIIIISLIPQVSLWLPEILR